MCVDLVIGVRWRRWRAEGVESRGGVGGRAVVGWLGWAGRGVCGQPTFPRWPGGRAESPRATDASIISILVTVTSLCRQGASVTPHHTDIKQRLSSRLESWKLTTIVLSQIMLCPTKRQNYSASTPTLTWLPRPGLSAYLRPGPPQGVGWSPKVLPLPEPRGSLAPSFPSIIAYNWAKRRELPYLYQGEYLNLPGARPAQVS
ncbi:hypothetical protein Pmani_029074 [Petrolisthes manimaculis]|uniref:Uncharacterized protein n=1 Tax=Petrolisthes manimaculis TaxID=1843537 RepID=A0AAE1P020_9EUCA|nr:hypothetical protein Pmani_029074 [Petrolisthes manimaculis]